MLFGEVNSVFFLGKKPGDAQKVVVSYKDSSVVKKLVGTKQRILYADHKMMEVHQTIEQECQEWLDSRIYEYC